jgi:TolB-like protein
VLGLKISLFGGFEVRSADGRPLPVATRKAAGLLAFLAIEPGTFHSRERLATLLWADRADAQARGSLRQTLTLLRKLFGAAGVPGIEARGDAVGLDPTGVDVDVAAFDAALRGATDEGVEAAVALYRGDLLEGFALSEEPFDEWLVRERAHRRRRALEAGEKLLERRAASGEVASGLALGERLLALEPTSEPVTRALMRLQRTKGARAAAVRQYERCRQALAAELGVEPTPETTVLWREILAPATPVPAARGERPSIAVLPFVCPPGDGEHAYFADGLVEDVIRELSRFRSLDVIARHSSFALRGLPLTARELGDRLGAAYLLCGTLRRARAAVRIGAELVEAATGRQLWAEHYESPLERVFAVQDEIARAVVAALALRIDRAVLRQARRKAPDDLEAYECWLRGLETVRSGDSQRLEEARGFFRRALAVDSTYARAHAGLSLTYFNEWNCRNWKIWPEREENAFDSARRAVELDDADHVTQLILGRIYLYRRDYERAEQHLRRAEELNPNDADLLAHLALGWSYLGDSERAQRFADLAVRLNPLHDAWYYIFMLPAPLVRRRFEDTVAIGLRCLDVAVKVPAYVAAAYAHLGEQKDARRYVDGYLDLFRRRITYGRAPEPGEALAWLEKINVFRRAEDLEILLDGLAKAGLSTPRREAPLSPRSVRRNGS